MKRWMLLALALSSAAFAPAPFQKPERRAPGDLGRMQGEWEAVTCRVWVNTRDGLLQADCPAVILTVTGGRLKLSQGGRTWEDAPFRLDRSRSPRAIDVGGASGARAGIYELEGGTLTVCDAAAGVGRPSDFAGGKPAQRLLVLKRKKP